MKSDDDRKRARIREEFKAGRGYWSERWEELLSLDADFFAAYTQFSSLQWRKSNGLSQKVREFLYVAIDASTTHLYDAGTRVHMQNAIRLGATESELLEVLELAALMGIQSSLEGASILREELADRGVELKPLSEDSQAQRENFVLRHGYWDDGWDAVLHLSPEFMKASLELMDVPKNNAALDDKTRALVNIALNASVTHLNRAQIRASIKVALDAGATADEIMEVLEVISVLGIHGCTHNLPILREQWSKSGGVSMSG